MYPKEVHSIVELALAHNTWRRFQTVNLIASENVMSPLAELLYINDLAGRYAEGTVGNRYYKGTRYVDQIEGALAERFRRALGAKFVDVRPISGTVANLAVYHALVPEGGAIASLHTRHGGHISHNQVGGPRALRLKVVELPWNDEEFNVDVDRARRVIEEARPSLVVLGASLYLFPHPVRELAEAARAVGAYLLHDSAHVFGLILGGQFPNPLAQGAHVVTTSTHKTFPGPQGGLVAASLEGEPADRLARAVFPVFTSNYHMHRYIPTYVTLLEMEQFGAQYAEQVVRNARALAEALAAEGLRPLAENRGYTRTHQVAVDVSKFGGGEKASQLLEEANIIVNKNMLPWDKSAVKPSGIRLGVQEMTRFGMGVDEMKQIAVFIRKVLVDGREPREVAREVAEFRRNFVEVKYGFKADRELVERVLSTVGL